MRTLTSYCDAVVLRHPSKGSADQAVMVSSKPIINAGDGTGEHPTQALLDLYTIQSELGRIGGESKDKPMVVTMLGDLKNGRTVHSLAKLLGQFENIRIQYVAPDVLVMPDEVRFRCNSIPFRHIHLYLSLTFVTIDNILCRFRVK